MPAIPLFVDSHKTLGSDLFPGAVEYQDGLAAWRADVDAIDGAKYLQLRITFVSNVENELGPELSAIGIPHSVQ
jgi:hypothetical protein